MKRIRFDFNNMFSFNIGRVHGVTEAELLGMSKVINKAYNHLVSIMRDRMNRVNLGLEWVSLPYQSGRVIRGIQKLGDEIARKYENVISLGIGGSYLGLKAAQDALCPPYYNEFPSLRKGRPRIYFEGNNLDPETLSAVLKNLNPKKTLVIVISKSGETTETKAAFNVVEHWLKKKVGSAYGRQIFVITDPKLGGLRARVNREQLQDPLSFRSLPLFQGVGGRYSELNTGLLHLAVTGVDIQEVLDGARSMSRRCLQAYLPKNPALMYAVLHAILYQKKGKPIGIMMPFSEQLKFTADWYSQLLAESTGKKYSRRIKILPGALESWEPDWQRVVNIGRTPVSSRGTNDLHSIQQNNIEGENNKTITFIRVQEFKNDIRLKATGDFLAGKSYSELLALAQEATEWALVRAARPNCTIIMPKLSPYYWGEMIFFFEMATAFEGELLNVNAFNQPGVEGYKNYLYYKLHKPAVTCDVVNEIRQNPLVKKARFII